MASAKLIFDTEQVRRLQTKIGQVSQDTNRLYLQMKGQSSGWSGIPVGDHLMKVQVLINELTVEAEKLEDIIRTALRGVEGLQEENTRNAAQLTQQFSLFAGMLGRDGAQEVGGRSSIPPAAQNAATNLIRSFAVLPGRDELDSDPAVRQLRLTIQASGPGSLGAIAAESKLKDIFTARDQIAQAQMAFKVYESFGNKSQMNAVHLKANEARQTLASLGIDEVHYTAGKDLSMYFKQPALQACDYDPSVLTRNVPLPKNESYLLLLRMAMEPGDKGGWAKGQLQAIHAGGIIPDLADWESQPAKKDFIDKYLVDPLIELVTGEKPQPKTQLEQVLSAQFYGMQIEQQFVLSDLSSEFESVLRGAASADRISEVFGTGTVNVRTGTQKNRQIEPDAGITGSSFGKMKALDEVEGMGPAKPLLEDFDPAVRGGGGTIQGKRFTGSGIKDYDSAAEAEYAAIRNMKMKDIENLAQNTGLSIAEIKTMKKHLFFGKHQIPQPGGIEFRLERFAADDEIAFAWRIAQQGDLSAKQKEWFQQLAAHELTERNYMAAGQKYRTLESWNELKGRFDGYPPGAHENAPSQPNWTFPGYEEYYFKNLFK
ncbi:hypothetical protein [Paenibacillus sp. FSL R7-0333]|uniref:hypothetical protein n=1 Tax=Paenibacillus sp. FSL R7-0333 TaxID=1926587 RepID=UPI00096C683D|nr:hypothetical protein BK146_12315 [Paenibacillus sp. FSL R7-0333]